MGAAEAIPAPPRYFFVCCSLCLYRFFHLSFSLQRAPPHSITPLIFSSCPLALSLSLPLSHTSHFLSQPPLSVSPPLSASSSSMQETEQVNSGRIDREGGLGELEPGELEPGAISPKNTVIFQTCTETVCGLFVIYTACVGAIDVLWSGNMASVFTARTNSRCGARAETGFVLVCVFQK